MGLEDKLGQRGGLLNSFWNNLVSALFYFRSADSHTRAVCVVSQIGRYFIYLFQGSKRVLKDVLVALSFKSIVLRDFFIFYINRAERRWKKADCCIITKWRWGEGAESSRWQGECGETAAPKWGFRSIIGFLLLSPHSNIPDDFCFIYSSMLSCCPLSSSLGGCAKPHFSSPSSE